MSERHAQGTYPADRWTVRAYDRDGKVTGCARGVPNDPPSRTAERLAERWMSRLPGTVRAEVLPEGKER